MGERLGQHDTKTQILLSTCGYWVKSYIITFQAYFASGFWHFINNINRLGFKLLSALDNISQTPCIVQFFSIRALMFFIV